MIFATVGTQLPFPRLIDALDAIAATLQEPIVAQVGASKDIWPNIEVRANFTPTEYEATLQEARVVVAHAGIGTILSAKKIGKPLLVLPRRYSLGEHRNDHQMATARQVSDLPGIYVAWETVDLDALLKRSDLAPPTQVQSTSHAALLAKLTAFINGQDSLT